MLDGVIKYHVEHTFQPTPCFDDYANIEALRTRLFALGLIGETNDGIGYGNLSHRVKQTSSFFITATQTGQLSHLSSAQYSLIKHYDFENFTVFSKGEHKPSSEALSHAMIYEIHADINAMIHIHSAALWQFMKSRGDLATTAEYGTTQMTEEIANIYHSRNPFEHNAFVMLGHEDGIITFGKSIEEAEESLYRIVREYLIQPN
ncbi:MAG: class II aldolase/adducin family protein [Ghiorsea sp.]